MLRSSGGKFGDRGPNIQELRRDSSATPRGKAPSSSPRFRTFTTLLCLRAHGAQLHKASCTDRELPIHGDIPGFKKRLLRKIFPRLKLQTCLRVASNPRDLQAITFFCSRPLQHRRKGAGYRTTLTTSGAHAVVGDCRLGRQKGTMDLTYIPMVC